MNSDFPWGKAVRQPLRRPSRRRSTRSSSRTQDDSDEADEADGEYAVKMKRGGSLARAKRMMQQRLSQPKPEPVQQRPVPGNIDLRTRSEVVGQTRTPEPVQQRPVPGNMDLRTRSEGPGGRGRFQQSSTLLSLDEFLGEHVPVFPFSPTRPV